MLLLAQFNLLWAATDRLTSQLASYQWLHEMIHRDNDGCNYPPGLRYKLTWIACKVSTFGKSRIRPSNSDWIRHNFTFYKAQKHQSTDLRLYNCKMFGHDMRFFSPHNAVIPMKQSWISYFPPSVCVSAILIFVYVQTKGKLNIVGNVWFKRNPTIIETIIVCS